MPSINFKGVKTEFEPVPDADYEGTLSGWKWNDASKSSGEPYVALEFTISEPGDFENRKLFRNYSVQPQALWALKRTLVRLGADPDALEADIELEDLMPEVQGAPCIIRVGHHEYEDTIRNDIKDIIAIG